MLHSSRFSIGTFLFVFLLFVSGLKAQTPNFVAAWDIGNQSRTEAHDVAVDIDENVIVAGEFRQTLDINPGPGLDTFRCQGINDVFLVKTNPLGEYIWGRTFGSGGEDNVVDIATDVHGNIYMAGSFEGTPDFDPGSGTYYRSSAGIVDIYVVKLDSSGNFLWARTAGSVARESAMGVSCDPYGNVTLTGYFEGTVDFDPGAAQYSLTSTSSNTPDVFIWQLNSSGNLLWARKVGGKSTDFAYYLNHDKLGNIYVVGYFSDTVDFDPSSTGTYKIVSVGGLDAFVAKYMPQGTFVWARSVGGNGDDVARAIAIDEDFNVFAGGYFDNKADFNPGPDTLFYSSAGTGAADDGWIMKLDSFGNFCWAKHYGGTSMDALYRMELVRGGYIYMTGYMNGTVDYNFDPNVTNSRTSKGGVDGYVLQIDTSGAYHWALNIGGTEYDICQGIATDKNGEVYLTGYFNDTADFDPGNGTFLMNSLGNNSPDAFVWHLSECITNYTEAVVVACDAYTWIDGNTYTSGIYGPKDTLVNFKGCDSIVTLNLEIRTSSSALHSVSACDSFVWVKGRVFYSDTSGVVDTVLNKAGCDSVVTLDLDIRKSSSVTLHQIQACDSFLWVNGVTYYTSSKGTELMAFMNTEGCDSFVYLDLRLSHSALVTDVIHACDSLTWIDGHTYYASSSAQISHLLHTASGCDSLIYLDLTLNQTLRSTHTVLACDSFTWINGKTYYVSSGAETHTLTTHGGCDSIVTLDLTIRHSTFGIDSVVACDFFQWIDGKTYYSDTSSALNTLTNQSGCDSFVVLRLKVISLDTSVQIAGDSLYAIEQADSYQWLDCANGNAPLHGGRVFKPTTNGVYSLVVESMGCRDTSGCHAFAVLGIEQALHHRPFVFPNPGRNEFTVKSEIDAGAYVIHVCNSLGQVILEQSVRAGDYLFHLNSAPGIYSVHVRYSDGVSYVSLLSKVE